MSLSWLRASLAALALTVAPYSLAPFSQLHSSKAYAEPPSKVTVVTHFDVIPNGNNLTLGQALLEQFVLDSRSDPGVISFTLITWAPTTNHFQVLEVFDSLQAFNRHVTAAHTIAFRTAMQQYIGSPIDERLYTQNKPDDGR
jgi:quinol monooxygenase YgiN